MVLGVHKCDLFISSLAFQTIEHLSVHERKAVILHNRADMVLEYAVIFKCLSIPITVL